MTSDTRIGVGMLASLAVCCAVPIALSLLGSGAVLSALSGVSADTRPLLIGISALLVVIGILVLVLALAKRARVREQAQPNMPMAREGPPRARESARHVT